MNAVLSCLFSVALWSAAGKGLTLGCRVCCALSLSKKVFWSTSDLRAKLASWNWFKSSSKIFYWPFQGGTSFVDPLCFSCFVFVMPLLVSVYLCLVIPAGKGLTSWLSFVVCHFSLIAWARCGTWLYWFLIFAPLLTFLSRIKIKTKK